MAKITDPEEISNTLYQIKQATEHGYYGPVVDIVLSNGNGGSEQTLDITVDYPNAGEDTFKLSVPQYWEDDRTLPSILNTLDVPVENMSELENRSVPIKRVDGSWAVDMERLNSGDYLAGNSYVSDE